MKVRPSNLLFGGILKGDLGCVCLTDRSVSCDNTFHSKSERRDKTTLDGPSYLGRRMDYKSRYNIA